MKNLKRKFIGTLLLILSNICFSYIFSAALACEYPNDPDLAAAQTKCAGEPGHEWVCEVGSCRTTQQATDIKNEYSNCKQLTDQAAQNACVENLANQKAAGINRSHKVGGSPYTISSLAAAYSGLLIFGNYSKGFNMPKCTSQSIFTATSLGFLVTDYMTDKSTKRKFESLKKDYQNEPDPYQKQVKAFEYLKKEQQVIVDVANEKKKYYTYLSMGYGLSMASAIAESLGMMTSCQDTGDSNSPEADGATAAAPSGTLGSIKGFGKMIGSSEGLIAASGIALYFTNDLRKGAAAQEKESKKNINTIQAIIDGFKNSLALDCPTGRENMSNLDCYCYLSDGSKNTDRTNSNACNALWDKKGLVYSAVSKSSSTPQSEMGCVTITQKFDPQCQCKKLKSKSTGENACAKVSVNDLGFGSLPNAQAFSPGATAQGLTQISQGQTPSASVNGQGVEALAIRSKNALGHLLKKVNQIRKSKGQHPINLTAERKRFLQSPALKNASKLFSGKLAGLSSSHSSDPILKKALKKLKMKTAFKYGSKSKRSKRQSKKNYDFAFAKSSPSKNSHLLKFGEKKYNFRNNDINQRSDVNIFHIISKRYKLTGLKALFDN